MTPGELEALILAADEAGIVRGLAPLTEPLRHALSATARAVDRRLEAGEWITSGATTSFVPVGSPAQRLTAHLAQLGTCTHAELRGLAGKRAVHDRALDVWEALRPSFMPDAAEALVADNPHNFELARRLVREGRSRRPTAPQYTLGLIALRGGARDHLLADPDLLDHEVWQLFEVEGGGEISLAAHDKYCREDRTWRTALVELEREGRLDRRRLLDASLAALERGFAQFRAGWFSTFHEALGPTLDERAERVPAYLRLLGSEVGPTVSFALKAVRAVDAERPIAAAALVRHLEPVLRGRAQGAARDALRLLANAVGRDRGIRHDAAILAAAALAHEAVAVQTAALDLLDRLDVRDDPEVHARIAESAVLASATLRGRLAPWTDAPPLAADPAPEAPVARPSRPDPASRLVPPATLDEVIALASEVLEDDLDPDRFELALAGIARVAADRAPDLQRRAGPLLKRAGTIVKRSAFDHPVRDALARVVIAWLTGVCVAAPIHAGENSLHDVLVARTSAVAAAAARGASGVLLSEPTHRGGVVDPAVLVARVRAAGDVDVLDAVIALLRLGPDGRPGALAAADDLPGEVGEALRYALGAEGPIGPTAAVWIAAARARGGDDVAVAARHPGLGPDSALAARTTWSIGPEDARWPRLVIAFRPPVPERRDPTHVAVLFAFPSEVGVGGWEKALVRWVATLWPTGTEALCAAALPPLWWNLHYEVATWHHVAYLEPLLGRPEPFGPLATLLVALELAARDPGESTLAVDVGIAALADGRLDPGALGDRMAELRPQRPVKVGRWARTLGRVAAASEAHARQVAAIVQRALRGDPEAAPRDEGKLVDLLAELLAARDGRVDDPDAWAYLSASRHARKVRRFAPGPARSGDGDPT